MGRLAKNRWHAHHQSFFNKLLLSYITVLLIPAVAICSFYVYAYSNELRDDYRRTSQEHLESLSRQIGMVMDNINVFSLQLSVTSGLNDILSNPDAASMYDYALLKEQLRNQIDSNKLFYSAYLYMRLNDKVITTGEGIFRRQDFYDQALIDDLRSSDGKSMASRVRPLEDGTLSPNKNVITFNRPLPITASFHLGDLVINVNKDAFFSIVRQLETSRTGDFAILDPNRQFIFTNMADILAQDIQTYLSDHGFTGGSGMVTAPLARQKVFINYLTMDHNHWTLINIIPFSHYYGSLKDKTWNMAMVALLIMGVGLLFIYIILENKNIKMTVERQEPIIKDRFIYSLLTNRFADGTCIDEKLQAMNITFERPYFIALIVDSDVRPYKEGADSKKHLLIYGHIENFIAERCAAVSTILDNGRFGYILNVDQPQLDASLRGQWKQWCGELNEEVQRRWEIALQFTFGHVTPSVDHIYESYEQARRLMNYKAVIHKTDVVFIQEHQSDTRFTYPIAIQRQLIHNMMETDRTKCVECIVELFERYIYNHKYPLERLQEMVVILMSAAANALLQGGYELETFHTEYDILKINDCRNSEELKQLMLGYVHKIIDALESLDDKKDSNMYIAKSIDFIANHYCRSISISDIAEYAGISSGYLSRIFKAELGKSPLEYLTECRMQKSKELLVAQQYSLQSISEMIGYNDVHSFIRYFKKHEGITPGEYRKKLL